MCVYLCAHMGTCIYVYVVYMNVWMLYVCVCMCIYTCMYLYVNKWIHIQIHTHTHTNTHARVHAHTYTYLCVYACTCHTYICIVSWSPKNGFHGFLWEFSFASLDLIEIWFYLIWSIRSDDPYEILIEIRENRS